MRQLFKYAVIFFLGLFLCQTVSAQDTDWDDILNRYEQICRKCIVMKNRIKLGETVSQKEFMEVASQLNSMSEQLKSGKRLMTPEQKKRFESIRALYNGNDGAQSSVTAEKKTEKKELPKTTIEEPVKREQETVKESAEVIKEPRKSVPALADANTPTYALEQPSYPGLKYSEPKEAAVQSIPRQPSNFHISAFITMQTGRVTSPGMMLFAGGRQLGGFISASSNFGDMAASYVCNSTGEIEGGGRFWGDGGVKKAAHSIGVGPYWRFNEYVSIYAGVGYGCRTICWSDVNGEWARVSDLSYGPVIEILAGGAFSFHHFSAVIGIAAPPTGGAVLNLGLGCSF